MAQIFKGRVYSSSPYPSAEINYEYSRDGANMKYRFTGSVYLESSGGWYYNNLQLNLYLNGSWVYGKDCKSSSKGWSISFDSGWLTVSNKTSGTTPFYFSVKDTQNSSWCNYTSGTYNLTVAPAYTSISKFNVHKRDETSVSFEWSATDTTDYGWYSKDNGATWHDLPTNSIITGLSANTTYNFKLRVRRADSQLTTDSGTVTQTTYDYPKVISAPNFTIGDTHTITVYNPLGRTCQMYLITPAGTEKSGGFISGTEMVGFINDDWRAFLYAGIPSAQSGRYKVRLVVESPARDTTVDGGTYYIRGDEVPVFSNFTYKDTNTAVTNVTGNNQVLVKGLSTLEVTIPSANKMVAVKSANPKNYLMSIDNLSKTVDYSTNDIVTSVGTVTSSGTKRLNVRAYDSRNLSTLAYKDITVYDYAKPVINASVVRLNNFETQTTLKVTGTYTKLNINNVDKNTMTKVQYRYREAGGTWSNWTTLNTTVTSGKFTCSDVILSLDNTKAFEFEIQAEDKLQANSQISSVGVGQAIFFISSNKKECYINGNQVLKTSDKPTIRNELIEALYPVGSVYTSVNATSPEVLFGGKWTKIDGCFLWATTNSPKNTGGSKTTDASSISTTGSTALKIEHIPSHNHTVLSGSGANGEFLGLAPELNPESGWNHYYLKYDGVGGGPAYTKINTGYVGGGQGHTHPMSHTHTYMPPFFEVYMWYRTA